MTIVDHMATPEEGEFFSPQVAEARRFFLGPPRRQDPGIVVGGGFERVGSNYRIQRREFPFLAVEFVVGGHGSAVLAGHEFDLTPGTIFTYSPRVEHQIRTDPQRPLAKYFADVVANPRSWRLLREAGLKPDSAWLSNRAADVQRLFQELIHHGVAAHPGSRPICDHLLQALLLLAAQSAFSATSAAMVAYKTYQRCCETIDRNALEVRTLAEVGALCQLDPAYICRLFRRYEGRSPYQRLLRARMMHAAYRLRTPGTLVKEVAHELGYSDPFHFSRVFKRVFACSPSELRV
jgi:AraC-like DNA-binding protein